MSGPECGIEKTLLVIGKKWTVLILREILYRNRHFGSIGRRLGLSDKVLAQRLRELEAYGVVRRLVDPTQNPPGVEYRLTTRGRALLPVLKAMYAWGYGACVMTGPVMAIPLLLSEALRVPPGFAPHLLVAVGRPAPGGTTAVGRKRLDEVTTWIE